MRSKKIFWGFVLVFIGTLLLLENFEIIHFSWSNVWHFWPIILIAIGINKVLSTSTSKYASPIMVAVTLTALFFLTFKGLSKRNTENEVNWHIFDNDEDEEDDMGSVYSDSTNYVESFDEKYKIAKLDISGGAGTFTLKDTSNELFTAQLNDSVQHFMLRKTETDTTVNLEFSGKNKRNFSFNSDKMSNAIMKMNAQPLWDINVAMGAGELKFDLSAFKIRNLDLKGGAAAFEIKLGDKSAITKLSAETGVASVNIEIPENSGCYISSSSGLSSKDFNGFDNKGNGVYETSNFAEAKNKIYITLKGGLSSFEVNRY